MECWNLGVKNAGRSDLHVAHELASHSAAPPASQRRLQLVGSSSAGGGGANASFDVMREGSGGQHSSLQTSGPKPHQISPQHAQRKRQQPPQHHGVVKQTGRTAR